MTHFFRGLRGKLLTTSIIPIASLILLTGLSIHALTSLGERLQHTYTNVIPNYEGLSRIAMQRARVGYFIWAALANSEDEKSRQNFLKKAKEAHADFKKGYDFYKEQPKEEDETKNFAEAEKIIVDFNLLTEEMILELSKNTAESNALVHKAMNGGEWHVMAIKIQDSIAANFKFYEQRSVIENEKQIKDRKFLTQLMLLGGALSSFALITVLLWVAVRLTRAVELVSQGLSESGEQVTGAIEQLNGAGQSLSQASTQSAASLEETVASLEELTSMVSLNSDNAKQAAALSQSSKTAAENGQSEIQTLISSMQDISASSKKIEEIISVIDDIAFQTNLLALNASVEAARAGEHGKGFAVVAEAVRALAQRSAVAAKDINVLIKESVDKVQRGSLTADKSGEVLSTIVNSVKKVSDLNNEIALASSEQTTGIQQISKAMNQLDQGAQANAAASEEVAASADDIHAQAQRMRSLVADLRALINGNSQAKTLAPVIALRTKTQHKLPLASGSTEHF